MEELTYEQLREVQKKERSTAMLSELPEDFYAKAGNLIARLRAQMNAEFALEKAREYENAVKVLRDIYSIREQKILLRAIRAAGEANRNVGGLAAEEKAVFEKVKEAVADGERMFESVVGISPTVQESKQEIVEVEKDAVALQPAPDGKKLKVIAQVPQFVGFSGKKYGPFGPGEVVFLPLKEGELLIKRKLAMEA